VKQLRGEEVFLAEKIFRCPECSGMVRKGAEWWFGVWLYLDGGRAFIRPDIHLALNIEHLSSAIFISANQCPVSILMVFESVGKKDVS
jgi:hypothetical protein